MTVDQSIALATSIAACLSAIATFWTVRQIAKQREASYRPELVFSRTFFDAVPDSNAETGLPTRWVTGLVERESSSSARSLVIPLRNVGLGAAKNVVILWSFPVEQTVEHVNKSAQRALIPAYFSIDELGVSLKSETLGNETSYWINQKKISLDFVLPASVEQEPVAIHLPLTYVQLCSAAVFFFSKEKDGNAPLELPSLSASIEYTDIGNRTHRSSFRLEIQIILIRREGAEFQAYIDCAKCA